jgi:serine/threonine protein kinase
VYRYPPFYDSNPVDIYKRIAVGYFEFSKGITVKARLLISGLLEKDLSRRLGCLSGGAEDVMKADWFIGVDWTLVKYKRIRPPWVPELSSNTDL